MRHHACTAMFLGALITFSCLGGAACAQIAPMTTTVAMAAVPTPFSSAKTAFLGFGGAASTAANGLGKDLPATLYQHSFKAIADTGRYRMVGSPAEADLCMAVSLETLSNGVTHGSSTEFVFVRLAISDCKTHAVLWTLEEEIQKKFFINHPDQQLASSIAKLTSDLNLLADGKLP